MSSFDSGTPSRDKSTFKLSQLIAQNNSPYKNGYGFELNSKPRPLNSSFSKSKIPKSSPTLSNKTTDIKTIEKNSDDLKLGKETLSSVAAITNRTNSTHSIDEWMDAKSVMNIVSTDNVTIIPRETAEKPKGYNFSNISKWIPLTAIIFACIPIIIFKMKQ